MELPLPWTMENSTCWSVVAYAAFGVEGEAAGFYVDFAALGDFSGMWQWASLCLLRLCQPQLLGRWLGLRQDA